jgi:hypothetical protein
MICCIYNSLGRVLAVRQPSYYPVFDNMSPYCDVGPGMPPPGTSRQSIMLRALLLASSSNRDDTHEVFRTLNSHRGTGVKTRASPRLERDRSKTT